MKAEGAKPKLDEAIKAGEARDYHRAVECLLDLLSQYDGPLEAWLYLGRSYHALDDHGRAISAFREYLERGGEQGPGYFFLGRSYLASGLPRQAAFCFQRSLDAIPNQSQCLGLFGYACLKLRRPQKALQLLEEAVNLAPSDQHIYRGYLNAILVCGIRKYQAGDSEMAAQMLSFAVANGLDAIHVRLYLASSLSGLGRWQEALVQYDAALAQGAADDVSVMIGRARALTGAGRAEEAARAWEAIQAEHPYLPGPTEDRLSMLTGTALAELNAGSFRRAADAAVAGLRLDPRSPVLHSMAGEAYRNLGFLEKAENHYHRAVEANRQDPAPHLGLAMTLWAGERWEEALREFSAFERAGGDAAVSSHYVLLAKAKLEAPTGALLSRILQAIQQRGPEIELMRAAASVALGLGQPSLALPWYRQLLEADEISDGERLSYIACLEAVGPGDELEEAYTAYLELYPDNCAIRREYADKLRSVERWEEAAEQYSLLVPYEGESLPGKRVQAYCLRKAGRYREAAVIYRDMALKDQDRSEWTKALCFCLYRMGKREVAAKLMEAASKRFPDDLDILLISGWLQARLGRREEAMDAFRRAADADPSSSQAWANMAALYREMGMEESAARCEESAASLRSAAERAARARKAPAAAIAKAPAKAQARAPAKASAQAQRRPSPPGRKAAGAVDQDRREAPKAPKAGKPKR